MLLLLPLCKGGNSRALAQGPRPNDDLVPGARSYHPLSWGFADVVLLVVE